MKNLFQAMISTENEAMEVDDIEEKDVKAEVKLKGIKIGVNLICQLIAENAGRDKKARGSNRVPILILDCSGSMGQWVQRSVDAWQRALRAQQYPEDQEVHMIEFESSTVMTHHKLKNLDSLNMHSRGGTSMAGVVSKLETLLIKNSDKTINIWVISDGQISDQRDFKESMTKKLAGHLNSPNVNVVGVRLCSRYSDPDVTAMSAVGLLSTQQFQLEDYQLQQDDYNTRDNQSPDTTDLVEILGGMRAPEEKFELKLEEARMVKRPGEDGQKVLDLWNGDWFII